MSVDPTNGKPLPTPEEVSHSLQKLAYHTKKNGVGMTSPLNREAIQDAIESFADMPLKSRERKLWEAIDQYAQQVANEARIGEAIYWQTSVNDERTGKARIAELDKERKQ